MISRLTILDHQDTPPSVVAHVWYSPERGITCDDPFIRDYLRAHGPVVPLGDELRTLTPADGRAFFEALPTVFDGLMRAQPVEIVDVQGGEAV
jgi:hypothetical protein